MASHTKFLTVPAIILHRMWIEETDFRWSKEAATAT